MASFRFIAFGLLATFLTAVSGATPGYGPGYSIYMQYPFKTFIRKVSLSLKVPATPNPQKDSVLIYPSLLAIDWYQQPFLASYGTPSSIQCAAAAGQWCAYASYFSYIQQQTTKGAVQVVKPGNVLQYNLELVANNGSTYLKTISRGGQVISQTSGGEQTAVFFLLTSECHTNAANLPSYTYSNITINLALQYPGYIKEASVSSDRIAVTTPYTPDGGFTWKIDTAKVQAAVCTV